jgi:hypothetical protein
MNNSDIFEKAQEKAKKNGWFGISCDEILFTTVDSDYYTAVLFTDIVAHKVIFSHDFAKAFWGEEPIGEWNEILDYPSFCYDCSMAMDDYKVEHFPISWKYHLEKMVLEEEPLKYLERFLDE